MSKNQTSYDDEFRKNAVDLFINSSRSYTEVASDLGINPTTLKAWERKFRSLHKELEYVRRQRDILKKAAIILGEDPRPGMS